MLSNTAKHFICYSGLIGVALFLFGLYHKADLQYTASQQQIVDSSAATAKALEDSQKAIASRDALLQATNAKLDKAQQDAKSLSEQVALVNELLPGTSIEGPTVKFTANGSIVDNSTLVKAPLATVSTSGTEVTIPATSFKILSDELVSCKKCENSLVVAKQDNADLKGNLDKQATLITAYQVIESKQPHTRWQKFRKGVRWVFSLGS